MYRYLASLFLTLFWIVSPSGAKKLLQDDYIVVSDGWVRAPIDERSYLSLYFNLHNKSQQTDYLVKVETEVASQPDIVKTVKINGINRSVRIEKVAIPPKTEVKFQPMGLHVIVKDKGSTLTKGDKIKVRLFFAKAGLVEFIALVI